MKNCGQIALAVFAGIALSIIGGGLMLTLLCKKAFDKASYG